MRNLFWLTDAQMARLGPFLPKSHGKPRVDDRRVLSGMILINRNGLRWRDAPKEYGPPKTLHNRWKRWSDKGVFVRMMDGLAAEAAVPKTVMIDVSGHAPLVRACPRKYRNTATAMLIADRIRDLSDRKTQAEIASEAGFPCPHPVRSEIFA